jgi:hypothetical protein
VSVTETYPTARALVRNYIAEPWERDAQGCLETIRQNNPYYPFAMRGEYNYIQCRIKKNGMKTYYDNLLIDENTNLGFPSFKNGDGVEQVGGSMGDDQALAEWELHTLDYLTCIDNH